ncbi:hypothetical protein [Olivibacter ginsenosidimutans]
MNVKTQLMAWAAGAMVAASLSACNQSGNNGGSSADSTADSTTTTETASTPISITPVADSKAFPGASLAISSITANAGAAKDSVTLAVKYDVKNFKLTEHTMDHNADHMANSAEGQHIHFILDNTPYVALYKPENSVSLAKGSEHYLLSFLSRSYHESIKEPKAYVLKHFKITEDGKYQELPIPSDAALFYSRPKGEYKGKDTEALLLDFYLVNTDLSASGNKVKVDVGDTTITLDKWGPYQITGAPKGDLKVKLTLVGPDGNELKGDNTSITRDVKLSE